MLLSYHLKTAQLKILKINLIYHRVSSKLETDHDDMFSQSMIFHDSHKGLHVVDRNRWKEQEGTKELPIFSDNSHAGVVVGVVVAIAVIALAVVAVVWLLRKRNILGKGGIMFDSKTFVVRGFRGASDTQQIVANDVLDTAGSMETTTVVTPAQSTKKQENLHASAAASIALQQAELTPTMMEELRLGTHGAGFKRFK